MAPFIELLARRSKSRDTTFSQGPGLGSSTSSNAHDHPSSHGNYHPGLGSKPPQDINNKAYFALFAILGAAMVVASIWFFFWAKNGGFIWRKRDWDDYKSTVLRRKDKDGKTLSNATPVTILGEKSIAGTFDIERGSMYNEKQHTRNATGRKNRASSRPHDHHRRGPSDDDLKAYRNEKPARVGGINRASDGSHFGFSSAEPSEVNSYVSNNSAEHLRPKGSPERKKGFMQKQRERVEKRIKADSKGKIDKKAQQQQQQARKSKAAKQQEKKRPRHTFAADEASSIGDGSYMYGSSNSSSRAQQESYYAAYRPPAPPHAPSRRHEINRQPSPLKQSRPAQRPPGSFDAYSDAGSSDTGTKVYSHHIPGLNQGNRDTGFRRGAPRMGRRDSLSDSENGFVGGRRR